MAENRSPFVRPGEALDYQPVAVPAVLAALTASIALVATVALVAHGLSSGRAAVYPLVLLIGAAGLFLAAVARSSIRRSEGTRAGLGMASAAWWASLASLIGYGAYAFGSEQAIRAQSVSQGEQFFQSLASKPNTAFFLTVEPTRRANIPPEDEDQLEQEFGPSGQLAAFRSSELVRLFRRNPGKASAKYLGVKSWEQTPTGYVVVQSWRVSSPEAGFRIDVPVFATEGKEVSGRQWHCVPPGASGFQEGHRTAYGLAVMQITREADLQGRLFCAAAGSAKGRAYEMTLPPAAMSARQLAASSVGLFLPPPEVPEGFYNAFHRAANGGPGRPDEFRAIWIRAAFGPPQGAAPGEPGSVPEIRVGPEKIEARFAVEAVTDAGSPNTRMHRGTLVLEATNPEMLAKLAEFRSAAEADPARPGDPESLKQLPPRLWRVVAFESDLKPIAPPSRGPSPGPPGGKR